MTKIKVVNEGGITGSSQATINTGSAEFRSLQEKILDHSQQRTELEKCEDSILIVRFRMEDYLNILKPAKIIPAGAFLQDCLEALNIKKKDFAAYAGFEASNLSDLIKGKRKINPEFAWKLGKIFNITPRLWLDIQNKNELLSISQSRFPDSQPLDLSDLLIKTGRLAVV